MFSFFSSIGNPIAPPTPPTKSHDHDIDEILPSLQRLFKPPPVSKPSERSAAIDTPLRAQKAKIGVGQYQGTFSASSTSVNSADSRKVFDSSPWLKSLADMQSGVDKKLPTSNTALPRNGGFYQNSALDEDEIKRQCQCLNVDEDQNGMDMSWRLGSLAKHRRMQSQQNASTILPPAPSEKSDFRRAGRGRGRSALPSRGHGRGGKNLPPTPKDSPSTHEERALQNQLARVLSELDEVQQLNAKLTLDNQTLTNEIRLLNGRLNESNILLDSKDQQQGMIQEELDQALQKLHKAERRNRYVDDSDRWKADANYRKRRREPIDSGVYGRDEGEEEVLKERRGAQGLLAKSVTEVTGMMNLFNEELFQTAAVLSELIKLKGNGQASISSLVYERAERVLGDQLLFMIHQTNPGRVTLSPLLVQIVLQVFLVFWCNSIIEAWYPKQATFAEFLVDICANIKVGGNLALCGKKAMITQTHTRESDDHFYNWVKEIVEDLLDVISVFGWTISSYNTTSRRIPSEIRERLMTLVKSAYDIRTAMAEISTSGDVDLVLISSSTPFNAALMENAYEDGRARNYGNSFVEHVVGTTGIGLQRELPKLHSSGLWRREVDVVLRPKVVLENSLLDSFGD